MGIITLPQIPAILPSLTFFLIMSADRPGHYGMNMKLQHLETGRNIVEAHGGITCPAPGPAVMPVRMGNVQFQAVGAYNFVVEIEGQRDPIITDFSVALQIPPAPPLQTMR